MKIKIFVYASKFHFLKNRYEWVPVMVEGYNEATKKYKVIVEGSDVSKNVGRLALLFNDDDPVEFKHRIEHSKKLREVADQEMRFLLFIENMTNAHKDKGLPDEVGFFLFYLQIINRMKQNKVQREDFKEDI